mgnify:CR=1 FL=1
MWPQITVLVIYSLALLLAAHNHGKPRDGEHKFQYSFMACLIIVWLLYKGGFFNILFNK